MEDHLLTESFADLQEDFEELLYLSESAMENLDRFISAIDSRGKFIRKNTLRLIRANTLKYKNEFDKIRKRLLCLQKQKANYAKFSLCHSYSSLQPFAIAQDEKSIRMVYTDANSSKRSISHLIELIELEDNYCDLIRSLYGIMGSLITSLDWQSPSFDFSLHSQAGKQTGRITGTINDYKRDVHLDEKGFEKQYLQEYVDAGLKFPIHAYMTASGMAAFTTILNYLYMEGRIAGKVLVGQSVYFQYKQLLDGSLRKRIIEVDEEQTDRILKMIQRERPSAIFLDSLCNSKSIAVPDLLRIINFLIEKADWDIYLVIDNTCLSVFFQPFKIIFGKNRKIHLIVFESLMKYLHFGLDRATGGIIVAQGKDAGKIYEYRKHSGTNIPDSSVYAFPPPERKMLERRLFRLQRNALLLAGSLQEYIDKKRNPSIKEIIYPGLSHHPSYSWSEKMPFTGSFFNIGFSRQNIRKYKKFINLVLSEAKKRKIQIVGGTSFGLNHTRIYLTSSWTKYGVPFVRVAAGTENRYQIGMIKEILKSAVNKIDRWW